MIKDKKMNMKKDLVITATLVFFVIMIMGSCTRSQLDEPSPLGPSTVSTIFKVTASPNVLTAGPSRQSSMITASLKKYNDTPLPGKTIHFDIRNSLGQKIYDGFFPNNKHTVTRVTDSQGIAKVKYYGPNAREISSEREIYIYAFVAWEGQEYLIARASIYVILAD